MISKDDLLASIAHETNVIKHIHSKLEGTDPMYRPFPGTRTLTELLQYLSVCCVSPIRGAAEDNWKVLQDYAERARQVTIQSFPAAMDQQLEEVRKVLAPLTNEDFSTRIVQFPWGGSAKLGAAVITTGFRFLSSYKLQLFLYAKADGRPELNTANAWLGADMPLPMAK